MEIIKRNFLAIFLCVTSAVILSIHTYLGSFTRLMADDFCSVYYANRLGMARYVWYWYLNWGGRYSAIAVDSTIGFIGAHGIRFVPAAVILIWIIVTSIAVHQFLRREINANQTPLFSIALSGVGLAVLLSITPMPQQVLYWWNGMRTYVPAIICFTFYIGFFHWSFGKLDTRIKLLAGSAFSFLLAFLSAGFNETFLETQFLFFFGLAGLGILTRKLRFTDPSFILLVTAFAASALSLVVMLASPGTANRQAYFTAAPGIIPMLDLALNGYVAYLREILTAAGKVTALIGLILTSIWMGMESKERNSNGWTILFFLTGGVFLSFASLIPSAYIFFDMPAARTYLVTSFFLVASLLVTGLMLGKWLANHVHISSMNYVRSGFIVALTLFVLTSTWINAVSLYKDKDTYISYAQRWDAADADIRKAKLNGALSIEIPAMRNWAGLDELNNNPKYWVTRCYALYYDFQVFGPNPDLLQP